ncbi:acetyl-CoA carboxylase biotin carboxyl carrier protein [Segetibacter sp. 3557_3]|uniref:acetyl-CoA carboxylase biotin carboxyl carrier protein n=1 Tax=Segetibacter sp. 3557_3 TaxID=2547429 RepID=UPI001058F6AF|nr:acetyl-CoA carboxylase biotin carboxyl carrier protein [Segetibacter sp. 3557_3]TDH18292.1 acetyl-CoA carboxylase biotin carboxyl carrier protein [Segetibacter sp. 3557_3]
MDFKQIQELIKVINKSNIGELTIEEKDFKITIKQKDEVGSANQSFPQQQSYSYSQGFNSGVEQTSQPAMSLPQVAPTPKPAAVESKADNLVTIKSPMIGTFYRSPSPDKPAFVNIGDEVTVGKPVCIIEAMKLFNEIESEISGKIVKVLAEDASPVEYDQPLFLVDPS